MTINNFIAPNINIMTDKTNTEKTTKPSKLQKKDDKNVRTHSEKETLTRQSNESLKSKYQNKSYKRNT